MDKALTSFLQGLEGLKSQSNRELSLKKSANDSVGKMTAKFLVTDGAIIVAEFKTADVVKGLRDDFGECLRIFKVFIEFELEKNLLSVQVDEIFSRELDFESFGEKILEFFLRIGFRKDLEKTFHKNYLQARRLAEILDL